MNEPQKSEAIPLYKLVSELSLEERNNFLEKLKRHTTLTGKQLYGEIEKNDTKESFTVIYNKLPWYTRFIYHIISIMKNKSLMKVFEDYQLDKLGRQIQTQTYNLFNYQHKMLLAGFYNALVRLKEACRFFYSALDLSVNREIGRAHV